MAVTSALVKELRERTGVGMMECKKALEETGGDLEAAITLLRKSGQAKAAKKLDRVAAEGVVVVKVSSDLKQAIVLELNCETDFASRDQSFLAFADRVAQLGLASKAENLAALNEVQWEEGVTVAEARNALVATIGENINLRRVHWLADVNEGGIYSYVHGNGKIGVLVALSTPHAELGKDLAMHIAAAKPMVIFPAEMPAELVAKEREIALVQAENSGKPREVIEKMVAGKVQKVINELALVGQVFIKDSSLTIEKLLAKHGVQVNNFVRFEVGEGVEKQEVDFAAEVKAKADEATR